MLVTYGGVLNPFEFESSTPTSVVQQIIALKTTKSKISVAKSCAGLISFLGMFPMSVIKVPYQSCNQSLFGIHWKCNINIRINKMTDQSIRFRKLIFIALFQQEKI